MLQLPVIFDYQLRCCGCDCGSDNGYGGSGENGGMCNSNGFGGSGDSGDSSGSGSGGGVVLFNNNLWL